MQSEQQYQQLLMQYEQLKNGAADIANMIEREDFDSAIDMIKHRESLFVSCRSIRRYLELTPPQQKEIEKITEEIKTLEMNNIKKLEEGMAQVQLELSRLQKSQKIQNAYGSNNAPGNMLNIQE